MRLRSPGRARNGLGRAAARFTVPVKHSSASCNPLQLVDSLLSALLIALTVLVLLMIILPIIRHAKDRVQRQIREARKRAEQEAEIEMTSAVASPVEGSAQSSAMATGDQPLLEDANAGPSSPGTPAFDSEWLRSITGGVYAVGEMEGVRPSGSVSGFPSSDEGRSL